MKLALPILYSFRRCPYAIRARLAIKVSNIKVQLREVILADKPKEMLACSSKGTVPVLQLADGTVIDESMDIMAWALTQHDPENWLPDSSARREEINCLIELNDTSFKQQLDYYKYSDRFPESTMQTYRQQAEGFLQQLEERLEQHLFLTGENPSLADMALLPFIRQFSNVDKTWFDQSPYIKLQVWLDSLLADRLFLEVMHKYSQWQPGNPIEHF